MEILTLLRLNGKRLAALLIVGAITGAIAAAVVAQRPANFEATTTVFVSQALPRGGTSFDVGPLVSDFQQAVTLPEVKRAVAEKLLLPATDIEVIVNRNGVDGGSVEVTAKAPNAVDAQAISQTVSTEGMRFLAQREVNTAASVEQLRSSEVTAAENKRSELLLANNAVDPVTHYETTLDNYLQLVLAKNEGRVIYTPAQIVQIDAQAAVLRQQLPELERSAEEFQKALKALENADAQFDAARLSHTAAKEVLAAATTDAAISAGETVETSNVAAIMQAFAAAVVAVLVVGVAFFALADSSRRRPARALPSEEADPPLVAAGAASVAPRGRALADTVMPAAYRPASLEAMESALESEVTARSEPTPASAAAPPTSARPATPTPVSARSTTPAGSTNGSSAGKSAAVTGPAVVSVSSPASPATGGSAKQASTTSSSSTGSPSTTGAPAPDGDKVSAAALTEDVTVEPVSTGSDVAVSGTEERKSGGGAGERPRRARRPEAQSMFARPAETTSAVTATPEEPESEVAPVNADARQRRSAANRRRLGN